MNNNKKIHSFFNASNDTSNVENVFVPASKLKSLRIAKTIQPTQRATFNEVFQNVRAELLTIKSK
jgi:hypothetical protein